MHPDCITLLPTPIPTKYIARLWTKVAVTPDSCWIWQGYVNPHGYGETAVYRRPWLTHRLAYYLATGQHPGRLYVLHDCPGGDNKLCVRPSHLWLGTHQDNMRDAARKGQMASGARNGTKTKPERLAWGDRNPARLYPERLLRGDRSPIRLHPECLPRGEAHKESKVTSAQVLAMRARYTGRRGEMKALAAEYGISLSAVQAIISRRNWKHLP